MDTLRIAIPSLSGQPPFMLDIRQIVGQELADGGTIRGVDWVGRAPLIYDARWERERLRNGAWHRSKKLF